MCESASGLAWACQQDFEHREGAFIAGARVPAGASKGDAGDAPLLSCFPQFLPDLPTLLRITGLFLRIGAAPGVRREGVETKFRHVPDVLTQLPARQDEAGSCDAFSEGLSLQFMPVSPGKEFGFGVSKK